MRRLLLRCSIFFGFPAYRYGTSTTTCTVRCNVGFLRTSSIHRIPVRNDAQDVQRRGQIELVRVPADHAITVSLSMSRDRIEDTNPVASNALSFSGGHAAGGPPRSGLALTRATWISTLDWVTSKPTFSSLGLATKPHERAPQAPYHPHRPDRHPRHATARRGGRPTAPCQIRRTGRC